MPIGVIILIILLFCIFGIYVRNRTENKDEIENNFEEDINDNKFNKIEEKFFYEVKNGKNKYKFLKIDRQFDLMFIKSIFLSENIPYYVEFENIFNIGDLDDYTLLYILDEDYDDAVKVIKNYLEIKRTNNENNIKSARNIFERIFGNWKIPSTRGTDGIEIIYKTLRKEPC